MSDFLPADVLDFVQRGAVDIAAVSFVVHGVYQRYYGEQDYIFTYVVLNLITFCLAFMLSQVSMELGFALGLFAVFGILRYRTEPIKTRDLTYLFVVIGMGLLNALANIESGLPLILVVNAAICAAVFLLESAPVRGRQQSKLVRYDRLELLAPGREAVLKSDLQQRTGLPIAKVTVNEIDLLRDTAMLTVHFAVLPEQDTVSDPVTAYQKESFPT